MRYAPRSIAFLCEVLHPPQVPDPASVQRVHNRMFSEGTPPLYGSFHATPQGIVLSNAQTQPGAVSSATFLADRVQFREELTGITAEDFVARLETTTGLQLEETPVPVFTAVGVTVRTLVNPRSFGDSRGFLKEGVLGMNDELTAFEREAQLYGLRLVFPPTQEEPWGFALRVESYAPDPRSVFLEATGTFGAFPPAQGLGPIGDAVQRTYAFVTERALAFLARFDQRAEA